MTGLKFTIASSILLAHAVLGQNQCPNGWGSTQFNNNDVRCCYGSMTVSNDKGFCCVHGGGSSSATAIADGHLIASPSQKCIDNVPFSADDYMQRVSAASMLAVASQTGSSQMGSNSASATTMAPSPTGSKGASATMSSLSSGATHTAASNSGSNSNSTSIVMTNAASSVTHGLVQVGVIVAVAAMLAI